MKLYFHGGDITWDFPIQKLIQIATDSEIWHVDGEYDQLLYIGASRRYGGVDIRPKKLLKPFNENCYIVEAEITIPLVREKVIKFLLARYGRKFDMLGMLYLGFMKITGDRRGENYWRSMEEEWCSQMWAEALIVGAKRRQDVEYLIELHGHTISPVELMRWPGLKLEKRKLYGSRG